MPIRSRSGQNSSFPPPPTADSSKSPKNASSDLSSDRKTRYCKVSLVLHPQFSSHRHEKWAPLGGVPYVDNSCRRPHTTALHRRNVPRQRPHSCVTAPPCRLARALESHTANGQQWTRPPAQMVSFGGLASSRHNHLILTSSMP